MNAKKNLEGKVVVVTGAGLGIGRGIALAMAAQGARVIVNDVGTSIDGEGTDRTPAQSVVEEIHAAGGEAHPSVDSVATPEGATRIIEAAIDCFGRIDCVVNNAGILRDRFFHKMSVAEWESVIDVHLNGSFYVSRAAAPHFKEQGSGSYLHMTSTAGLIGNTGQANYSAAKMGIVGLSRSIALDMQRFSVRSNCIAPAAWSRMVASIPTDTPEQKASAERKKELMTPEKIAPLAAYLASDIASGISGQIFGVRGNQIYLYSQPRALQSVHRSDGWDFNSIAETAMPAFRSALTPLEGTMDVLKADPI